MHAVHALRCHRAVHAMHAPACDTAQRHRARHFSNTLTLNPFLMSNSKPSSTPRKVRVDLFSVALADDKALTAMQTKLNQWLTAGTLVKYQIHTTSTHALFNVCRRKDAE